MNTYQYKGNRLDGHFTTGTLQAYDEYDAQQQLRKSGIILLGLKQIPERKSPQSSLSTIREKELALLCSQLSIILATGMSVVNCVEMVADQAKSTQMRRELKKVAADIASGYSVAQSFEKNMARLPAVFVETLRAGEQFGTLELCFRRLHQFFDKSAKTKAKAASALTYPAIVICLALLVFGVILVVAVPMFSQVFHSLGTELPGITKALLAVSDFLSRDGWVLLVLLAMAVGAWLLLWCSSGGRFFLARLSLSWSPLRKLHQMQNAALFAHTMSTMLTAGLTIPRALEITSAVMPNPVFGQAVGKVLQNVRQGRPIAQSMSLAGYFPKMLTEMTGVGEHSGALEETLTVIGDYFDHEVQVTSDRLLAVLEPGVTVALAIFTVFLLLAVYLPLFGLYGGIV